MRDPVFNPMDADYLENPYPKYRELREEHPVYYHEGMNSWAPFVMIPTDHDRTLVMTVGAVRGAIADGLGPPADNEPIT